MDNYIIIESEEDIEEILNPRIEVRNEARPFIEQCSV